MDVVLGVSMTPTAICTSLAEGDHAAGVTIDEDMIAVPETGSAPEQVVAAILNAQEGAAEGGYRLASIGVTCTDQTSTAALSDLLADRKTGTVMLVSGFLAAAALTQTVGRAIGYAHTALLYLDPDSLTLAVVDSGTGGIGAVHRRRLYGSAPAEVTEALADTVTEMGLLETRPGGVYLVGAGVDTKSAKASLEALTPLPVNVPEEPAMALAQGAAVAAAHAPLFTMSTQALAYSRDPGTDAVDPDALALSLADGAGGDGAAYSANPYQADQFDDFDDPVTSVVAPLAHPGRRRRAPMLVGSTMAVTVVIAMVALVISLALDFRPAAQLLPNPGGNVVVPTQPVPPQTIEQPAPVVQQVPPDVAAPGPPDVLPVPRAPVPVPIPVVAVPRPAPAQAVVPQRPAAPIPDPPAAALPDPPAAAVPIPVPVPIVVPQFPIFAPPPKVSPPKVIPPVAAPEPPEVPTWQPPKWVPPKWQPEPPKAPEPPEVPTWQPPKWVPPKWQPQAPKAPAWQPKAPAWQPKAPAWQPKAPAWQPKAPAWQPKAPSAPKLPFPNIRLPF